MCALLCASLTVCVSVHACEWAWAQACMAYKRAPRHTCTQFALSTCAAGATLMACKHTPCALHTCCRLTPDAHLALQAQPRCLDGARRRAWALRGHPACAARPHPVRAGAGGDREGSGAGPRGPGLECFSGLLLLLASAHVWGNSIP